ADPCEVDDSWRPGGHAAIVPPPGPTRSGARLMRRRYCTTDRRAATGASASDGSARSDRARGAVGRKTGAFEKKPLISSQANGRMTSRYASTWPNVLSGPHDSVAA